MLLSVGGTPAVDFWVRLLEAEGEKDPKSDAEDNDDDMVGELEGQHIQKMLVDVIYLPRLGSSKRST